VATIGEGQTVWSFQEHYKRPARPFRTIRVDAREAEDPTALVVERIEKEGDLSQTVVRVIVTIEEAQEPRLVDRDLKLALKDAYDVSAIQRDVVRPKRDRLGGVSVEALTPLQVLDRYFDTRKVDEARKKLLLEQAEELMREVDAQAR
jgi:hypothetical protein